MRSSDLFLSVQAVGIEADKALFAGAAAPLARTRSRRLCMDEEDADEQVCFAVFILDPVHEIRVLDCQPGRVPAKWIRWLDAARAADAC